MACPQLKANIQVSKGFFYACIQSGTYIKTGICLLYSAPFDFSMADMTLNTIKNAVTVFLFAVIIDNKENVALKEDSIKRKLIKKELD